MALEMTFCHAEKMGRECWKYKGKKYVREDKYTVALNKFATSRYLHFKNIWVKIFCKTTPFTFGHLKWWIKVSATDKYMEVKIILLIFITLFSESGAQVHITKKHIF